MLLTVAELAAQDERAKGVAMMYGFSDAERIEKMMVVMEGYDLGQSILIEQTVKPYMMPVRRNTIEGENDVYCLASALEYYVNFDNNFKDNLSPDYIQLSLQGTTSAPNVEDGLRFLAENGTVSAAVLPFESPTILPAIHDRNKFKLKNYLHVFQPLTHYRQKIFEVRRALLRGNPVIVNLAYDRAFAAMKGEKMLPKDFVLDQTNGTSISTFLVVGYNEDDAAFEVRSTWGKDWGSIGYMWIPYSVFTAMAQDGYVMVPR